MNPYSPSRWSPFRDQPHWGFVLPRPPVPSPGWPDPTPVLETLEERVPGAMVYVRDPADRNRITRWSKLTPVYKKELLAQPAGTWFEVHVPLNGAYLVHDLCSAARLVYNAEPSASCAGLQPIEAGPAYLESMAARGRLVAAAAVRSGLLKDFVLDDLTDYQAAGVGIGSTRPWFLERLPAGSGKTLLTLVLFTARRGGLVVCPAKARRVWWNQCREYTNLQPYRVLPKSVQRAGHDDLSDFLAKADAPLVILGGELVGDYLEAAAAARPRMIAFDEIAELAGNSKRWVRVGSQSGEVDFEKRKTDASQKGKVDRVAQAVGLMEISRLPSLQWRVGLTATPMHDGRPRRLWAIGDLLGPGQLGFGPRPYKLRYCNGRPAYKGVGLDDSGSSNLTELTARQNWYVYDVPYEVTHAQLPSTRVEVCYLAKEELNRADAYAREAQQVGRQVQKGEAQRTLLLEVRLAKAASMKRKRVLADIEEVLRSGGKAVLFTARRKDCERWVDEMEKLSERLGRGDDKTTRPWGYWGHGGTPEKTRMDEVELFEKRPGPGWLVGTAQAYGTAVDGLQQADFAAVVMLPYRPGDFIQWKGRFDRIGGVPTLLRVYIAEDTVDERVVDILTSKFGPIEQMFDAGELKGMGDKLLGLDGDAAEGLMADLLASFE